MSLLEIGDYYINMIVHKVAVGIVRDLAFQRYSSGFWFAVADSIIVLTCN